MVASPHAATPSLEAGALWYRWPHAALPSRPGAAPALQKFAGDDFIPGFLAQPQHSLVFDPEVDVVSTVDLLPVISGGDLTQKLMAALFANKSDGTPVNPGGRGRQ